MTIHGFNPDVSDRHEFPKLEAQFDEDPSRFLQSSKHLALARIGGVRDEELLEAYRAVAKQILTGNGRSEVLEAIDTRERELAGEPITTKTPTTAITDGGQTLEKPEPETEPAPEPDETHPDVSWLEAGEVLRVARGDTTEFIFPTTPSSESPYLLRAFDAEGNERTSEPLPLETGEIQSRLGLETEKALVDDVDVRPPSAATTSNDGREIVTDGGKDIPSDRTAQLVYSRSALMIRSADLPQGQPFPVGNPIGRTDPSGQICTARISPQLSHTAAARSFSALFVIQSLLDRLLSYLDLLSN